MPGPSWEIQSVEEGTMTQGHFARAKQDPFSADDNSLRA